MGDELQFLAIGMQRSKSRMEYIDRLSPSLSGPKPGLASTLTLRDGMPMAHE